MSDSPTNKFSLTQGGILNKLLLVALPIMGTQIIQMTYNLTDMFWLGRVGSVAIAASGTVGMYMWLSMAFVTFGRMGAEIGVSQNLGRQDPEAASRYAQMACFISVILGVLYALVMFVFRGPLVGFFAIAEQEVVEGAEIYLAIIAIGIPFSFLSSAITGVFNGSGNSRLPFYINAIGLIINMALDPILIFNLNMGIAGAAIATIAAQIIACVLSVLALLLAKQRPFQRFSFWTHPSLPHIRQIFIWATPLALESFLFTFLSMIISRLVAAFGAGAMAAQRVGSQIESLSWLIAGGYASALTAFIGQNFGAGKWSRIHKGFSISTTAMCVWGAFITLVLFFGAEPLFKIFVPNEPDVVAVGVEGLKILALCQLVACLEGIAGGAFRGIGKTLPPSLISISANVFRVVLAYFLSSTALGLSGIWWAISIGAFFRGAWMYLWYLLVARKMPKDDAPVPASPLETGA